MAGDTKDWLWWSNSNGLDTINDALDKSLLASGVELAVLVGVEVRSLDDVDVQAIV